MATSLPTMTRTIDDAFVNTWYEIRSEVIDQVLTSNPLLLALQEYGCMKTQVGSDYITRTVGYGTKSSQRIQKGSTLKSSDAALDTMATWAWRYLAIDVTRARIGINSDQTNQGPHKIKDFVTRKIENATACLKADMETFLFSHGNKYAAPQQPNGIYDITAPVAAKTAGDGSASDTYAADVIAGTATNSSGNISRSSNTWWRNQIKAGTTLGLTMVADMRNFMNTLTQANSKPNLLICSQDAFETYEDEGVDKIQIVRTGFDQKAFDLGFATQTFKGCSMIYSPKMPILSSDTLSEVLFIDTNYLEMVYDPTMWFEMTDWLQPTNQLERVAYILCATTGTISSQLRAQGYLYYTS